MKHFIIAVSVLSILIIIGAFLLKTLNITPLVKAPSLTPKGVQNTSLIPKPPPEFPPDETVGCVPGKISTLDKLTQGSETIVYGKVDKITAEKESDGSIYSTITLAPIESFKKAQTTALSIRVRGGEINGIGQVWGCTAKFRENEQVIVFLKKDLKKPSVFSVVSGLEGKFTVHQNEVSRGIPQESAQKLEDFKNNIKKLTGNQSFKAPFSYFSFVKNLPNRFFGLFIHQAFAWLPITTPDGFGIRWYPGQGPIKYYMHDVANSKVGDQTWDAANAGISWWANSGANFSLDYDPTQNKYSSFYDLSCNCWRDSLLGDGKNQIVFQNRTDLLTNPDNRAETAYTYDCNVSPKKTSGGYTFCKLTEADITVNDGDAVLWPNGWDPVTTLTLIVGHETGHSLGLYHSDISPAVMRSSMDIPFTELQQDDTDGITSIYPADTTVIYYLSSAASNSVIVNLLSGTTQQVNLTVSGLPTGTSATWPSGSSVNPTDSRPLTITTSSTTPVNTSPGYTITITGTSANTANKTTSFKLFVYPANTPAAPTISATPFCVSGGSYTATLSWSGTGYNTTSCGTGFWVDIDNDSNWGNGYYHKCVPDPDRSTSAPFGFGAFNNATGTLTFQPDVTYYARTNNGTQSAVANIGPLSACPSTTPTPTPTTPPSSSDAWIQTTGGDVHSNTGIIVGP